ncbi:unnamed protein product [Spirodela intermedia]|uniref:Uncharacterized protein n=1 Tax=Spirodela intermedia TaxID=51605 RepID=A0A7I8LIL1_SPIIN|nr:unnamed protein product [Spirodela intermedia]
MSLHLTPHLSLSNPTSFTL